MWPKTEDIFISPYYFNCWYHLGTSYAFDKLMFFKYEFDITYVTWIRVSPKPVIMTIFECECFLRSNWNAAHTERKYISFYFQSEHGLSAYVLQFVCQIY